MRVLGCKCGRDIWYDPKTKRWWHMRTRGIRQRCRNAAPVWPNIKLYAEEATESGRYVYRKVN